MKGKFNSDRDAMLYQMSLDMWANDSDGDSASLQGWFARMSNSDAELPELIDAFRDDTPAGFDWETVIGHFLIQENSDGIVTVTEYPTASRVEAAFTALFNAFHSDIDY
jgi:hypothetical protein